MSTQNTYSYIIVVIIITIVIILFSIYTTVNLLLPRSVYSFTVRLSPVIALILSGLKYQVKMQKICPKPDQPGLLLRRWRFGDRVKRAHKIE